MKVSIIIPVFNEEKTIAKILRKVKKVNLGKKIVKEIIVVNDASTDKTASILNKIKNIILITHQKNQGKGAAVRSGIKNAKGKIILIQDADLEYDPNDYSRLITPILTGKTEVVYGTRLKDYPLKIFGKKRTPLITHYFGNRFLSMVTNILYGNNLTDMETCYKVFKKNVVEGMMLKANRFDFEAEITAKIMKRKFEIYEVPIKVKPRGYEEGKKISWKDGFIAIWTLIKYRLFD